MPYKFSPSSLNLLKECPRCFWLHFNRNIRRPNGIFPSLPSGMDRILKVHFDSFRDKNELPPELKKLKGVRLFSDIELLKTWRNNLKGIQYKDPDGNLIRGAVDNILEKKEKLIVLDYKTRGFPLKEDTADHYQDQLDLYNFLLRKNGFKIENYAYLLFYHPDRVGTEGEILFHTDLVERSISTANAEKIIKNALKTLGGSIPESPEECEFCRWREQR
ncbi:PD-(D/E)XK nuclease family protein [Candidatus Woesearchaeota archaeon]|nr:PD-(D/E)XK nuclease family protein [Candidatus Woesearchaeota archaeon]